MNYILLTGRVKDTNKNYTLLQLKVSDYENKQEYIFDININESLADKLKGIIKINDYIAIKGKITETKGIMEIKVNSISCLQSGGNNENN